MEIIQIYKLLLYKINSFVAEMRFAKQSTDIPIGNAEERAFNDINTKSPKRHGDLLPNNLRCIVAGPSGCGKTNVLIGLIENEHGVKFENLYIYSKTLDQSKYKYLREIMQSIPEIGFYTFSPSENIIDTDKMKQNSLIVFDDVINDREINKSIVRNIFTLGRHRNLDVIYIVQSYTKLDKHLIRDNCNFVILFRQDDVNLKHVYSDFCVNADMNFDQFKELCHECWREPFGFACVSLEHDVNSGRYRKNFNEYLQIGI